MNSLESLPLTISKGEFYNRLVQMGFAGSYDLFARELNTLLFSDRKGPNKKRYRKKLSRGECRRFLEYLEE